jgi:protein subunit release factor B
MTIGSMRSREAYKIIHLPTSISVTCDLYRHQYQNKLMCEKLLKAKLWAAKNLPPSSDVVAIYELPDGIQWPDNLNDFREQRLV